MLAALIAADPLVAEVGAGNALHAPDVATSLYPTVGRPDSAGCSRFSGSPATGLDGPETAVSFTGRVRRSHLQRDRLADVAPARRVLRLPSPPTTAEQSPPASSQRSHCRSSFSSGSPLQRPRTPRASDPRGLPLIDGASRFAGATAVEQQQAAWLESARVSRPRRRARDLEHDRRAEVLFAEEPGARRTGDRRAGLAGDVAAKPAQLQDERRLAAPLPGDADERLADLGEAHDRRRGEVEGPWAEEEAPAMEVPAAAARRRR